MKNEAIRSDIELQQTEHMRAAKAVNRLVLDLHEFRDAFRTFETHLQLAQDAVSRINTASLLLAQADAIDNLKRENERLRQGLGDPHAQLTSEGIDGLANWRLAVETALGLEHDPVNHTPEWAHKLILHMREIGNAKQEKPKDEGPNW